MPRMFERTLPVVLTVPELIERGHMLAAKREEANDLEADKKATADDFKKKLESAGKEIDRLAHIVRTKAEDRPVKCKEIRDYKRSVIEVVRLDNGELVSSRVMTESERQREIAEIGGDEEAEEDKPQEKPAEEQKQAQA